MDDGHELEIMDEVSLLTRLFLVILSPSPVIDLDEHHATLKHMRITVTMLP